MLHIYLCGFQLTHGKKQSTPCQQINYYDVFNNNGYFFTAQNALHYFIYPKQFSTYHIGQNIWLHPVRLFVFHLYLMIIIKAYEIYRRVLWLDNTGRAIECWRQSFLLTLIMILIIICTKQNLFWRMRHLNSSGILRYKRITWYRPDAQTI